jgi:hypothetical protein
MKEIYSMRTVLLLGAVLFMLQSFGQGSTLTDAKSVLGINYVQPVGQYGQGVSRDACQYILDDGTQETSIGFTGDADVMWLNYFTTTAGCEMINTISLAWGVIDNGGSCRVILYEDPDDDGNPDDAVYLTEATTTIVNANTDIFTNVSITPTLVSGGFFVAALTSSTYMWPAALDQSTTQAKSWIVAEFIFGGFDVNNLMNNDFQPELIDNYYPGNWLLRAEGEAPNVPLSNWALFIGIGLILVFAVVRLRKMV